MLHNTNENRKRIVELLAFFLLFLVLSSHILNILNIKSDGEDLKPRLSSIYSGHYTNADVVIAGSSHAGQIYARQLWQEHGIAAFTLAGSSQPVDIMYYEMKEYLKYHKPKVFMVETVMIPDDSMYEPDTEYVASTQNDSFLRFSTDYMAMVARQIINYDIPFKDEGVQLLLKWPLVHDRYKTLTKDDYEMEMPYISTIFEYLYTVPEEEASVKLTDERIELSKFGEYYLNKIIKLCRKNKVQLVLFHTPYPANEISMAQQNTLADIAKREGIPFLDFNYMLDEIGFDVSTDQARDLNHMNYSGAAKVTGYIGTYLSENYGLEDHRYDVSYVDWEKDIAAWVNMPIISEFSGVSEISDYEKTLQKYMQNYVVVMSLCGNYVLGEEPLKSLIDQTVPESSFYEKGGAIVIDHGQVQFYSDGAPTYTFTHQYGNAPLVIDRHVTNDEYMATTPKENTNDSINICLEEYAKAVNGLNITVYDDFTGQIIDSVCIDIYQSMNNLFRTKTIYE